MNKSMAPSKGHAGSPKEGPTPRHISPVPTRSVIKTVHGGQLLTPIPGRLTPTGQGRIKAPPVCKDAELKKVASSFNDFNANGVCFSLEEAEGFAQKAIALDVKLGYNSLDDMPLNLEDCDAGSLLKREESSKSILQPETLVSSNCTVVTTSSAGSCGRGAMGKSDPPLEVVQALSATFTDKLVKENSSRQGRSLQRWLVHSSTEQLVRQVAGTIPITRDGRIILASASRKKEWILPKGGWDEDETKEECAARETFEEAGLLGRLGGCLEPIDYETSKAKKRRLSMVMGAEGNVGGEGERNVKKAKATNSVSPSPAGSDISSTSGDTTEAKSASKFASPSTTLFDPKNYSYVRLFLCPLYVTEVKEDWPEKGRLRKMVHIDEAIKIMEDQNRLYFKRGLEMVKERGLHLVKL